MVINGRCIPPSYTVFSKYNTYMQLITDQFLISKAVFLLQNKLLKDYHYKISL